MTSPNGVPFTARSNSVELVVNPERSSSPARHPSPDLISFSSAELPTQPMEEPQRVQTPEPPVLDAYTISYPQPITRTTPRSRPALRRDIFSPASKPVTFGVEDRSTSSAEFTPRAHSTLRHRKGGMFMLLNDSITGELASEVLGAADANDAEFNETFHEATLADDELTDCDYNYKDNSSEGDAPVPPQLSLLFPLQLVLLLHGAHSSAPVFSSSPCT
ncbi:hypothetical protein MVEN_02356600 [Mycena venus]|uniref:Uncharacterized protein n=1 Tax=Mycena venus TaxID=2733690 RepID=A0A8H6X2W1_9AGAR|nr:hypothetical protein MVEN_02356600 [Mycena venus]